MKKSSKRKKSEDDSENKCKKAFEENIGRTKKHSKKHKEGKKAKKSKHKSKEKLKFRSDKKEKDELKEKLVKETNEMHASQDTEKSLDKKEHEKTSKSESMEFNEAVGKAILGNLKKIKKHRSNKNDFSSLSSSCSEDSSKLKTKNYKENGDGKVLKYFFLILRLLHSVIALDFFSLK